MVNATRDVAFPRGWNVFGQPSDIARAREQPGAMCVEIDNREIDIVPKLNTLARNKLPAKDFAEPKKRAYPVEDKAHARNAKARASQAVKAGRMSKAEEAKIDKKADAVLQKGLRSRSTSRRAAPRECVGG